MQGEQVYDSNTIKKQQKQINDKKGHHKFMSSVCEASCELIYQNAKTRIDAIMFQLVALGRYSHKVILWTKRFS